MSSATLVAKYCGVATRGTDPAGFREGSLYSAPMALIDLRSDTVTRPTAEMRRAMAAAEVGDDVWGEDPSVNELEERAAELLGKAAGLFVASGTMANLAALVAHVPRGGEIIAGGETHIVNDEAAGHAVVVGASIRQLREAPDGTFNLDDVEDAFRDATDIHQPPTALVGTRSFRTPTTE